MEIFSNYLSDNVLDALGCRSSSLDRDTLVFSGIFYENDSGECMRSVCVCACLCRQERERLKVSGS